MLGIWTGPMRSKQVLLLLFMLLLSTCTSTTSGGYGSSAEVFISGSSKCYRGFPCSVNVTFINKNPVKITVVEVYVLTPWGAFGRHLRPGVVVNASENVSFTVTFRVPVKVAPSAYAIYPQAAFYDPRYVEKLSLIGDKYLLPISEPNIVAELNVSSNATMVQVNRHLGVFITYSVLGMPDGFTPSMYLTVNGSLQKIVPLNETTGSLSVSLLASREGKMNISVILDYRSGKIERSILVTVKRAFPYEKALKSIVTASQELNRSKQFYNLALQLGISVDDQTVSMLNEAESLFQKASQELKNENPSVIDDAYRAANLSKEATSKIISNFREDVLYRISSLNFSLTKLMYLGASGKDVEEVKKYMKDAVLEMDKTFNTPSDLNKSYFQSLDDIRKAQELLKSLEKKTSQENLIKTVVLLSVSMLSILLTITVIIVVWRRKATEVG